MHPWYIKKRAEDYKDQLNSNDIKHSKGRLIYDSKNEDNFYQIIHQKSSNKEEKNSFLKCKKERKDKKKRSKDLNEEKSLGGKKHVSIEKLREERIEREMKERKRIQILLDKNKNKK